MALYSMLLWSASNITTTGPNPFARNEDANGSAPGNSTITFGAAPSVFEVNDTDPKFGDGDNSQTSGGIHADPEYSYVIRPQGSSNPADNIIIYKTDLDQTFHGIVADGPIATNVTYDIIAIDTSSPNFPYATAYICFASGTGILTPRGEVKVEDLAVGDLVITGERGPRPLRWIGRKQVRFHEDAEADQKPVEFKPGSLGNGYPDKPLIVSPQHRLLVLHPDFPDGVLLPAKGMTGLPGVRAMSGCRQVAYFHLLFDRHEIVFANGCATESFLLGDQGLNTLGFRDILSLNQIGLNEEIARRPVRPLATVQQSRDILTMKADTWSVPGFRNMPRVLPGATG